MAIKVVKAAEIVDGYIVPISKPYGEVAAVLTNLEYKGEVDVGPSWVMELVIGEGVAARNITVDMGALVSGTQYTQSLSTPIFIKQPETAPPCSRELLLFRDRFFMSERLTRSTSEREEVVLRAKRIAYEEEGEMAALRSYVSNVEAAFEYQRSGPKREPIPDDVKLLVWSRDGGACVRCQSKEKIHFDHVIPVVKGGSNDAANVQLLCQICNLKKSDRIAF